MRLGDPSDDEGREARRRLGIPERALRPADARHPLTLGLLAEVRAALTDPPEAAPADRDDVFTAHLDLICLRVARRLTTGGVRGTAVRRLAAKVAGQVHEAARHGLGPGSGALHRETFAEVFPWGAAPERLGGHTGWASAVLAEGLLVPAASRPLRRELPETLLARERDTDVLDALLHAAAHDSGDDLSDLVHRVGLLLGRTPEGAVRFDRALVDLGRQVPGFAARVAGWLADAPGEWAALVGPASRRTSESDAGPRVPRESRPRAPGRHTVPCALSQPPCRCGRETTGMAPLDLRTR
ncbi:hypothetical protein [Streptomyces sp. NPDC058741]|uniref:hypothetical protein n=1 Tax=Streptomyces sp. NPDC058741 TaxID=3346620 RepID=UPI0036BC47C8